MAQDLMFPKQIEIEALNTTGVLKCIYGILLERSSH